MARVEPFAGKGEARPGPPADWWRRDTVSDAGHAADPRRPGSAVSFWALMTLTFILLLAPQAFFPVLAPLRIALLTAALAITTHLFDRFIHREPLLMFTPELRIAAGLVGWATLTAPFSYWPGGSIVFIVDFYSKTLAVFWLLGATVDRAARLRQVAWALSLLAVPLALTAIANLRSGSFMEGATRIAGYDAPLTGNPNDLALMLNLILPLTVALVLIQRHRIVRTVLILVIALDVAAVVATYSRAGFITLATILGIYLAKLLRRPQRGWALTSLVLLLICIPLLPVGYVDRLGTIVNIEADTTGSAQARWNDTVTAMRWVLDHPIVGAGVGQNVAALNELRGPTWKVIHNAYLEYAVELGVPGLALFLWLLVRSLRNARSVRRRSVGVPALRHVFHLAEGIEVGLVAFAVAALFSPVGYHLYFYYLAGLAVAAKAAGPGAPSTSVPDHEDSSLAGEQS